MTIPASIKPTAIETPTVPEWLAAVTPGLGAARVALDAARAALAAVKRPEGKTLNEVGIRTSSTEWKPAPRVSSADFDAVRVAWETYDHDRSAAERVLDRAVERFEGLLYGAALDGEAVEARRAAAEATVESIDADLENGSHTGTQRRALEADRVMAATYALITAPGSLRVLALGGKVTALDTAGRVAAEAGPGYAHRVETGRVYTAYGVTNG
ncbi:hypothetical protein [Agromyces sp. CCNWLW203]|uniref:hypothetical protein n=1 Tax=Agromyces sp. CCNWLW203 TaxID=3112842 RepID=UPI002F963069